MSLGMVTGFFSSSPKAEEVLPQQSEGFFEEFTVFSEAQGDFVQTQPTAALIVIIAGTIFGFPSIMSFHISAMASGVLLLCFSGAIAKNVWDNEGMIYFITRVIRNVKSTLANVEERVGNSGEETGS